MIKKASVITASMIFSHLVGCSASNEICQRSPDFDDEYVEFRDDIQVLLHTRPYNDTHDSFHAQEYLYHRWALIFLYPNTRKIVTHEGSVENGTGMGCSYNYLPPYIEESSLRLIGNVSGNPKLFQDISREAEKKLDSKMRMIFYSRNFVIVMSKLIGQEIWMKIKYPQILIAEVENLYSKEIVNDFDSIQKILETSKENTGKRYKTMTWGDFKCLFSLGLYALEATLIPYMLKQGPLILLAYSFAIDLQATTTYEHISKTIDAINLSDFMKIMVGVAKSLYFCLHWISGTVHTLLVLRYTITAPKMMILHVMCVT